MLAFVSLVVGVLVGMAIREFRNDRSKDGRSIGTWTTFKWQSGGVRVGTVRGGVGLIAGGGWRAAVTSYDVGDDLEIPPQGGFTWRIERLKVIAWELIQRVDEEPSKDQSGEKSISKVHRTELWAHCMWPGEREIVVFPPDHDLLIAFIPPGEDVLDEELARREAALSARQRKIEDEAIGDDGEDTDAA